MRVPVTDAFDESDHLASREVELTTKQVEWLEKKAAEQGLSFDHMLRSVITAQIRTQSEGGEGNLSSPAKGDGSPSAAAQVSADGVAASDPESTETDDEDESNDPSSIVDSLRSASERLQDLTEQEDTTDTPDPHDTLRHLQARLEDESDADDEAEDASHGTVLLDDQSRSMFDMMEEE